MSSLGHRCLIACLGLVVVGAGCTSNGSNSGQEGLAPGIVALPTPAGEEAQPTRVPEGRVENKFDLELTECFNEYELANEELDTVSVITTVVDCRRPHDGEVFATYFHPAVADAPYPGDEGMRTWANINCLTGFNDYIGQEFVVSELEIATINPTEDTWTGDGLHREIICYVFAPGAQLSGPMEDSGI